MNIKDYITLNENITRLTTNDINKNLKSGDAKFIETKYLKFDDKLHSSIYAGIFHDKNENTYGISTIEVYMDHSRKAHYKVSSNIIDEFDNLNDAKKELKRLK